MREQLIVRKYKKGDSSLLRFFCSGNEYLDDYVRTESSVLDTYQGCTYLLLNLDSNDVVGYYTITSGSVDYFYEDCRVKSGGAVHIECLAIDKKYQKTIFIESENNRIYFSDFLLDDCLSRIEDVRNNSLGFMYITLNATQEGINLYKRHGFEVLDDDLIFSVGESEKLSEFTKMILYPEDL